MPGRKVPKNKKDHWEKKTREALYNIPERWRKYAIRVTMLIGFGKLGSDIIRLRSVLSEMRHNLMPYTHNKDYLSKLAHKARLDLKREAEIVEDEFK